jgi:hypothetical protein
MAKQNTIGQKVLTPEFRVSFANVFEAIQNQSGKWIYELTMLFSKATDISALTGAARQIVQEVYGADFQYPPAFVTSFKDGDVPNGMGNIYEGYAGCNYVRAWSKNKPGIVDANMVEIINPSEFYSGCYARATVTPFIFNNTGKQGISWFLNNIQKIRDGEPMSGGSGNPQNDFSALAGGPDDPNAYNPPPSNPGNAGAMFGNQAPPQQPATGAGGFADGPPAGHPAAAGQDPFLL